MQIWPAIDLRDGRCVRLLQGDYQQETVYDDDPSAVAVRWVGQGARQLHLVDLDGARDGSLVNLDAVKAILAAVDVPCQLGGGVRDERTIALLLELGLRRLVVGTRALEQPEWFRRMAHRFPRQLVLGVDARNGLVATEGWLRTSGRPAIELAQQFSEDPLAAINYTDIETDGTLGGPNVAAVGEMVEAVRLPVIASGGVSSASDIVRLAETRAAGCIIGKALYEKKLTVTEALAAASRTGNQD